MSITEAAAAAMPLDRTTMLAGAARLLADGGAALSDAEIDTLRLQLRGHIELLIPAVESAAAHLPVGGVEGTRVRARLIAARSALGLGWPGDSRLVRLSVVVKLARSVRSLCGQLERLGDPDHLHGRVADRVGSHLG
ncbi:DUF6415 family natural product biosynthesis protein [Streptomyces ossamyceticus]|uniref:DUF6415 family natural product biosynthesis protein n=1 Tax=Streptomyces ossamyceticus TaxID=249581 RepID=UPI003415CD8B